MRERINGLFKLFQESGFQLFMVGGAVRDIFLRGVSFADISDYDFATDAIPEKIKQVLQPLRCTIFTVGEKFGTIGTYNNSFQITTFRTDKYKPGSRFPEVEFSQELREDLSRRDFTFNSLAMDSDWNLIDLFGGQNDWKNCFLRTPLNPDQTFQDDPLRMLRAYRFLAQF